MPDWSYHPIFKPILFRLPPKTAERVTFGAIGALAAMPGGRKVIDFIGHMKPAAELRVTPQFRSPVGLGCGFELDPSSALALSDFGMAFIELGPLTVEPVQGTIERDEGSQRIIAQDSPANLGLNHFVARFGKTELPVPLLVRIAHPEGTSFETAVSQSKQMIDALRDIADYIVIDTRWSLLDWPIAQLGLYFEQAVAGCDGRVLLQVSQGLVSGRLKQLVLTASEASVSGFVVSGGRITENGRRVFGRVTDATGPGAASAIALDTAHATASGTGSAVTNGTVSAVAPATGSAPVATSDFMTNPGAICTTAGETVSLVRNVAPNAMLIAGGGIIQPEDALALLDAGADMVSLYSGLVYSGPGLPKRIHEAVLARRTFESPAVEYTVPYILNSSWLFLACFGIGLVIACISAITVGLTTVILPYDETFVRLQREAFNAINPHLLHFMEHDRVTYAGTSLSTGLLFATLAVLGMRTGHHWAYIAIRNAGLFGLLSFMLFLGYHYLDPLHAFVTILLVPFYVWGIAARKNFIPEHASDLKNDAAWYRSLYGQLLFVAIGIGLMLAGATICYVGISTVFVPEDLMFMHTTSAALMADHPHLLPAIAHDRAGFGGALVTIGIAVLITALQGFRRGAGWVWWMLMFCALPAFVSTLGVHYCIGYTNLWHLTPVYIAFAMYCAGVILSYEFLCYPTRTNELKNTENSGSNKSHVPSRRSELGIDDSG